MALQHPKQCVALTGRNTTGSPYNSVGRPTAYAPGGWPARPPAALQTTTDDDDRQQTPARKRILAHYWASNNIVLIYDCT